MAWLTRGALAKRCGVNVETLRYYERRGLIPKPVRSASNYRLYDEETLRRVRSIKRAQALGFTLEEIKELLSLREASTLCCAEVRERARVRLQAIDDKIRSLQAMRRALETLVRQCDERKPIASCPILAALDEVEEGVEEHATGKERAS